MRILERLRRSLRRVRTRGKKPRRQRALIISLLLAVALTLATFSLWPRLDLTDLRGLALNLATELAGAVVTYLLLERVIGGSEEREDQKARLILDLGSTVHDVAIPAAEKLRERGWLRDGSLQGAYLRNANLSRAELLNADLQRANLAKAKLERTYLWKAHLQRATLVNANLRKSVLVRAELQGAYLMSADLEGAELMNANLHGADLRLANLRGASLQDATLTDATLPNGTKWTVDTNMARFTDPNHPNFWRSDDRHSPAYCGKDPD